MCIGLPSLSALFLFLERVTHYEFLFHVAAIPLEILLGAFLVKRFLAEKEKEAKRHQLMYIKSFIFRSEMRNLFIANFSALAYPDITIPKIKVSSLQELKTMRSSIDAVKYRSPEDMEAVIEEYVNSHGAFYFFMDWAIANDFEGIFHDMLYILHFIQDVKLYKKHYPDKLFIEEAKRQPYLMTKVNQVLQNGIIKFLEYAIELKEQRPDMFEELLADYQISSQACISRNC
jgi:hypothetical protein